MNQQEVLTQINTLFIKELDNPTIELTMASTANDVEDWDSLSHIYLVVAIEKHFGIRFLSSEVNSFLNIGEMVNSILNKKA